MKRFEQLTIKQVKKEIIAWETEMGRESKTVKVICVGQGSTAEDIDANIYTDGNGATMEEFFAVVVVDGEEKVQHYLWDCDDEEIYTGDNDDPQQHNDDEQLPPNIVERCKYVGQRMDTADLSDCHVNPEQVLKVPVKRVRWNYPFVVEGAGYYNVYQIEPAKTWGELLTRVVKVFQREYAKYEYKMNHAICDYIIEQLDVHPNELATVSFGS